MKALYSSLLLILATTSPAAPLTTTVAGTGTKGFAGDEGPAGAALLNDPTGVCGGPDGSIYICDTLNHRIRKVTPDGKIVTIAGTGEKGWSGDGGPATGARLNEPYEIRLNGA